MADIRDLKSRGEKSPCGFDSRLGHFSFTSEKVVEGHFLQTNQTNYFPNGTGAPCLLTKIAASSESSRQLDVRIAAGM